MIYTEAQSLKDLQGILQLQSKNLERNITEEMSREQGFVTVEHDLENLQSISGIYHHVIAKNTQDDICGYTLVMLKEYGTRIPILIPMFNMIDNLIYKNEKVSQSKYVVMGQVCIDEPYRGKGVFANLYTHMSSYLKGHFDYVITEIATRNQRSIRAHQKSGFVTLHEYTSDIGEEWSIVILEI